MNFNKHIFTKEQFLNLPVYSNKNEAPKDKTPFIFGLEEVRANVPTELQETFGVDYVVQAASTQVVQKERLLTILEHISKLSEEERGQYANVGDVNVQFSIRHGDGNISTVGGKITMRSIIESMMSPTAAIMTALNQDTPVKKDEKTTIDLGDMPDSNLSFTA